jgi:hypothetical protein
MNATKSRRRRTSQPKAEGSSFESKTASDIGSHSQAQRGYLHNSLRFQMTNLRLLVDSFVSKFSDDLADADILKENLAVLQVATKTLQHAYGIIASLSASVVDCHLRRTTSCA